MIDPYGDMEKSWPRDTDKTWQHRANCRGLPPDLFMNHREDLYGPRQAIAICAACEVRVRCLQSAMTNNEVGIWGGTTRETRHALKKAGRKAESLLGRTCIKCEGTYYHPLMRALVCSTECHHEHRAERAERRGKRTK